MDFLTNAVAFVIAGLHNVQVYGPGTAHRPTVRGGRALVLYLLPEGAIDRRMRGGGGIEIDENASECHRVPL